MFLHTQELLHPVNVGKPDARFGQFLLEQFGGATGELTAALQYWVQSFHVENAGIRDMLQDIAVEEFGHLEMVGQLIAQHTSKVDQTDVYDAPLFRMKGGHQVSRAKRQVRGRVTRPADPRLAKRDRHPIFSVYDVDPAGALTQRHPVFELRVNIIWD